MKEVGNGEVQNKGSYTRTTSNGVYSLINVGVLLIQTRCIIRACYGLIQGEEHLNERVYRSESDLGVSVWH